MQLTIKVDQCIDDPELFEPTNEFSKMIFKQFGLEQATVQELQEILESYLAIKFELSKHPATSNIKQSSESIAWRNKTTGKYHALRKDKRGVLQDDGGYESRSIENLYLRILEKDTTNKS